MTDLPFLFDPGAIVALQKWLGLGWPEPWVAVSALGISWGVILAVGIALWLWGREAAYPLMAVVVVEGLLKTALNRVISISRPDAAGIVKYERVSVSSFPSGHVSTATSVWGWLAWRGRVSWPVAVAVAILVGVSRLYLGVHYVGDVLGGFLLAALVIALGHWLWPPVRGWLGRRPFRFFATVAAIAVAVVIAAAFVYFGDVPYRWRSGGMVLGLALGLPLEYRLIRYEPGDVGAGRKLAMVLIGGAGIAGLAAIDMITGQESGSLGLFLTTLAALWAVLLAPTLFVLFGWARRPEPRRARLVRRTGQALGIATVVLALVIAYGGGIEPRLILDTEEHTAEIPGLPPAWEGAKVAVVSDFQVGLWLDNTGMLRRAVRAIVDERPDLVLLGGDFIYHPGSDPGPEISHILDILRPLLAEDFPLYAVLGNHDWGVVRPVDEGGEPNRTAARMLRDSLEAAGISLLHNRAEPVVRGQRRAPETGTTGVGAGEPLYVVGVGSRWMDLDDPRRALADVPDDAARIVLIHHPDSFEGFPARTAPLAIAGHTHGGQVRLPFTPGWSWLTFVEQDEVHADGWIERDYGQEGNRLYVTRGLGMSVIPLRINCPPELTLFTLRSPRRHGA